MSILTAAMSTKAVAREFNVHLSTISHLHCFREFGKTETMGLHNRIISAQTVRNHLSETHLRARHPHQGLDLTAVPRHVRPQWENAHFDGHWHAGNV